jgi:hypothetical protein
MNNEKKLVVIINHFEKDTSWAKNLKHPYIIYNKNPEDTHLFEVNMPNLGFDTIAYMTYIVDNYDSLPDYVCFLQDDPFYHCGNSVEIINEFDFLKPFYPMSHTYFLANWDWDKTYDYAERVGLIYTKPLKMIASCQCIVSRELILKTPKEMYKKLISTINHTVKCQENYCIENLWPTILNFNEELEPSCDYCIGYGGPC